MWVLTTVPSCLVYVQFETGNLYITCEGGKSYSSPSLLHSLVGDLFWMMFYPLPSFTHSNLEDRGNIE